MLVHVFYSYRALCIRDRIWNINILKQKNYFKIKGSQVNAVNNDFCSSRESYFV